MQVLNKNKCNVLILLFNVFTSIFLKGFDHSKTYNFLSSLTCQCLTIQVVSWKSFLSLTTLHANSN